MAFAVVEKRKIVLVSGSPRRKWLLERAHFEVSVQPPDVDEAWPGGDPLAATVILARRKLAAVAPPPDLALAADTMVLLDGAPMGKPRDDAEATAMLLRLSGRRHQVVTGFCASRGDAQRQRAVTTDVWFRPLSLPEIQRYVATGEPLDKAGAYGIQGLGRGFVETWRGSYTNVMGLPLADVLRAVRDLCGEYC